MFFQHFSVTANFQQKFPSVYAFYIGGLKSSNKKNKNFRKKTNSVA